jgi:hypothetical protein
LQLEAEAKQRVLDVLPRYSAAYHNHRLADVQALYPSLNAADRRSLRDLFSLVKDVNMRFDPQEDPRFSGLEGPDGTASATLRCRRTSETKFSGEKAPSTSQDPVTVTFVRRNGTWTIRSIEITP